MGVKGFAIQFKLDGEPQLYLPSCRAERAAVESELKNLRSHSGRVYWFEKVTDVQIVPVTIVVDA
jgi:hypothetical protein